MSLFRRTAKEPVGPTESRYLYLIAGMSSVRSASALVQAVAGVDGVLEVDVDLGTGRLTVEGAAVDAEAVEEAVAGAGCRVVASI